MSGLVAFTGPPDPQRLRRMAMRLSHRGRFEIRPDRVLQTEHGSIGVLEWDDWYPPGQEQSGIHSQRSEAIALSGFAFDRVPPTLTAESLSHFRGSFTVASIVNSKLQIARDAHGCQSLFYGRCGDRWLVATEPKAITGEAEFFSRIRVAGIAEYLSFSFTPTEHTMLEEIYQATAGTLIGLQDGHAPTMQRYFNAAEAEVPRETPNCKQDDDHWIQRTRTTIEQAVAERMPRETPLVFLSGGLDSSIVAAEVAKQRSEPIRTFSIHFGHRYPNELPFAAMVAERIGSQHEEVLIEPKQFLPNFETMIGHLDEPIGDPITQPNFELAEHAARFGSFVFNGEGGDPLFGGPKNLPLLLKHWYGDSPDGHGSPTENQSRERAYLASYRRGYEEWQRLLRPEWKREIDPTTDLEGILRPYFQDTQTSSFLNKLMRINIELKGANLILPKVDRMLAAHGMTPLSPLFDDRLSRLSFEMPPTMKLRNGIEKYVLKKAYENDLPIEVVDRPKSGMRVPVHYWLQPRWFGSHPMRRFAKRYLNRRQTERTGIFDPDRVEQLWRYDIEEGPGRYGLRLWMLLTFEMWRQSVIENHRIDSGIVRK